MPVVSFSIPLFYVCYSAEKGGAQSIILLEAFTTSWGRGSLCACQGLDAQESPASETNCTLSYSPAPACPFFSYSALLNLYAGVG